MAESLMDIKRRIASTKKTGQITNAMQMVSGAKLTQIEKKSNAYQLYEQKLQDTMGHLVASKIISQYKSTDDEQSQDVMSLDHLLKNRPIKKTGYIVVTSDRGLVGSYNSTIIKATMDLLEKNHQGDKSKFTIIAVGGTGADFFKKRGYNVAYEYRGVEDVPKFLTIQKLVKTCVEMFDAGVFDQLYICHNHHVNSLTSTFKVNELLPISRDIADDINFDNIEDNPNYIIDPSVEVVLQKLVPQYIESIVFGSIMDAKTAEHAASMSAMRTATDNADDLIASLSLKYNRARQEQITTEITEIIGGASALE
ncbi:MAG: F0F1 ATP synthase subunit gamma [Lactobacillus sp.]|uniref:F0F1 ATP synthase subunit gamma n=1 Tax=Bombilactobacillus bombi TaxID=1303590 RepID=UPI000E567825|nr:F0F1 ATP synthase subunit gamma [Bombilactobacillus bombi]AXX64682.1 F0F1 ATP synthase subunit gamma [Bombilactobacillus bombi]MCO6542747.1 F0F1 ATP synthase subunit gamma [Lactobacillus sp.]